MHQHFLWVLFNWLGLQPWMSVRWFLCHACHFWQLKLYWNRSSYVLKTSESQSKREVYGRQCGFEHETEVSTTRSLNLILLTTWFTKDFVVHHETVPSSTTGIWSFIARDSSKRSWNTWTWLMYTHYRDPVAQVARHRPYMYEAPGLNHTGVR